jgi:hypothetical protein
MKVLRIVSALLAAGWITLIGMQPVAAQAQAKPTRPEQAAPKRPEPDRPDHRRPHRERPDRPGDNVRRDHDRGRPDRPDQGQRAERPERSAKK